MNYYERHLGDYAKDTGHLTMLEHGAYTLLLDRYYSTEQGIPADQAHRIARARSKEERAAVDSVLAEFFTLTDGVWTKGRVQEEIAAAATRISAAKANGKKGGRPKKNPEQTQEKPSGLLLGSENETQMKALHLPSTIYQETPKPPRGAAAVSLKTWAEERKAAGEVLIPDDDPVFDYAAEVGIPDEFMALAWVEFKHRYTQPGAKKYKDWRSVFRKAVRGNWLKLWFLDGDGYRLTTVGQQAQRAKGAA